MTTLAIINQKGGTGKTTTTINLAAALADVGKKVLVIDIDPQSNLSFALGLDSTYSLANVFQGMELSQLVQDREGFQVLASNREMADFEISLLNQNKREYIFSDIFKTQEFQCYEFLLLDCPPSLSLLSINSLQSANYAIIPLQLEVMSIHGLQMMELTINNIKEVLNKSLEIIGILPVMYDKRRNVTNEILTHIQENFTVPIFKTKIRTDVKVIEAPSFGQSIIAYSPSSHASIDYKNFTKELLTNLNLN